MKRHFITPQEKIKLYDHIPACVGASSDYNLQDFISGIGIHAILCQCYRYIEDENVPKLTQGLQQWIRYVMKRFEHRNIALNRQVGGKILSLDEAMVTYNWQYMLHLPVALEKYQSMYQILLQNDLNLLYDTCNTSDQCSVFKAVSRLIDLQFTSTDWKQHQDRLL
jgi:hypothetical protein